MSLLSFKQAFRDTCSKINHGISNTLTFLLLLVTCFATGAIASLFIPQLITTFGIYSCIVGGSAAALAFLVIRIVFSFTKNQFNALFGKKTLTQKELNELEVQQSIALKHVKETEKKELAEINKKIKKDIATLETDIFGESVSSSLLTRIISNKWNERDQGVIGAYLEMQRAYLELEFAALHKAYVDVRLCIEQEFAKIRENAEQEGIKTIRARLENLINHALTQKEAYLSDLQHNFKTTALHNYPILKDQILHKDLYGKPLDKSTKINDAMIYKMLKNGYCPLVSDCADYKIFWHSADEFSQEYQQHKQEFASFFHQTAVLPFNQNNPKPPGVLNKVKNFFSKNKKESAVSCTNISPTFSAVSHVPAQQNFQVPCPYTMPAPCPYTTIQTTHAAAPLTLNYDGNKQKIITQYAI